MLSRQNGRLSFVVAGITRECSDIMGLLTMKHMIFSNVGIMRLMNGDQNSRNLSDGDWLKWKGTLQAGKHVSGADAVCNQLNAVLGQVRV